MLKDTTKSLARAVALLAIVATAAFARADIVITLNKDFIKEFRNKISISADFTVDKAHQRPNPGSKDGDLHIAGRAPQIGLPTVAEIMNAAERSDAVDLIHTAEQSAEP